jgi:hypothetical protein
MHSQAIARVEFADGVSARMSTRATELMSQGIAHGH